MGITLAQTETTKDIRDMPA